MDDEKRWCRIVRGEDGVPGFMCGRGAPPAVCRCGRVDPDYLCDYPMGGGATCDAPLCERCRAHVGDELDLCREHHALWRNSAKLILVPGER
jgi:hypothetical protein